MGSIKFRRSSASGLEPTSTQVNEGELAINLYDKKLYTADQNGDIVNIGFSQEYADETYVAYTGGVMKGKLYLKAGALPVSTAAGLDEVISRRYVDNQFGASNNQTRRNSELDSRFVQTAGGSTVQGSLFLNYNPSFNAGSAATNVKFVKDFFVIKSGDAMQGPLMLFNHPTSDWMASTKFYVDQRKQESTNYTDSKHNQSIGYTDSKFNQSIAYTDQKFNAANNYTLSYANQKYQDANAYTDSKFLAAYNYTTEQVIIATSKIAESRARLGWTGSTNEITVGYVSPAQTGRRLTIILNEGGNVALTTIPYHYMAHVKTTGLIYIDYGDSADWVLRYTYTSTGPNSGYIVLKVEGRGSITALYDTY